MRSAISLIRSTVKAIVPINSFRVPRLTSKPATGSAASRSVAPARFLYAAARRVSPIPSVRSLTGSIFTCVRQSPCRGSKQKVGFRPPHESPVNRRSFTYSIRRHYGEDNRTADPRRYLTTPSDTLQHWMQQVSSGFRELAFPMATHPGRCVSRLVDWKLHLLGITVAALLACGSSSLAQQTPPDPTPGNQSSQTGTA
jgi:hypothetical protein